MMKQTSLCLNRSLLLLGLALGLAAPGSGVTRADDLAEIDRMVVEFDVVGKTPAHHADLYVRISTDVGVPVAVLKERHARWHLTWGELYMVHLVVWQCGRPFEVILADRRAGKGWGVIAQTHGVKLGKLVSAAHKSEQAWKDQKAKGKGPTAAQPKHQSASKADSPSSGSKGHSGGKGKK